MRTWLLDTGAIVAYLDSADPFHSKVSDVIDGFDGRLATTGAVLTEAMYFVSADPAGPRALAEFVGEGAVAVYDLAQAPELEAAATLMERYADTPMDCADATLVLLGEALGIKDILTLDRRGFSAYRMRRRRAFRLVLDEPRAR